MGNHSTLYEQAHLVIAALRLWVHREGRQPTVEDLSDSTGFSLDATQYICKRLEEVEAITITEGAFENRFSIQDHLMIEEIPELEEGPSVDEQLSKIESERREREKSIEERFAPDYKDEKKAEIFSKAEDFIRDPTQLRKENPLDGVFGADKSRDESKEEEE